MSREHVSFAVSDSSLREAAESCVLSGASGLGCALFTYLIAAATDPGVLLSPVSILLVGFGARRAFDGRVRQPGLGVARPRGFREHDVIPEAARIGVPTSLAAVFVAMSYDERSIRSRALRAAMSAAKSSDAPRRAAIFDLANSLGATALTAGELSRSLVRAFGPAQGGLLTADDFARVPDVDLAASTDIGNDLVRLPFSPAPKNDECEPEAIAAIDRRGTAVVICYGRARRGVALLDGELVAPRLAEPVRRGVPRVRPGTSLPQAAFAEIQLAPDGVPVRARDTVLGISVASAG